MSLKKAVLPVMDSCCFCRISFAFFIFFINISPAVTQTFKVIPLGVKGGGEENNLSAYLVAPAGDTNYLCLDAGTIRAGIQQAIVKGIFKGPAEQVIQHNIKGWAITHPHLDHVAGMVINSPDDIKKNVYGLSFCLDVISDKYFSWKSWANFGDKGEMPRLNKYHFVNLQPGRLQKVEGTAMEISAFTLSHSSPYQSTAFVIGFQDKFLLYLGDTGADAVEKSTRLTELWKVISPLIKSKKLKAIFIEVSFGNDQKREQLFGHLTPRLLMDEMHRLALQTGIDALKDFPVVITHRKPGGNREEIIEKELLRANDLGLKLYFAEQAVPLLF